MNLAQRYESLLEYLRSLGPCAVAFSGGTDSTFLLKAARDALEDAVIAVTISTPYMVARERAEARMLAGRLEVPHRLIEMPIIDSIRFNPKDRCYRCKYQIFSVLRERMTAEGYGTIIEGTNADDRADRRPGMRAIEELHILSPLRHAGFTKEAIREVSRTQGLPTWNKPSNACLLSRLPQDREITTEELERIEKSEEYLTDRGFRVVRVRSHGDLARIECGKEERRQLRNDDLREAVSRRLRELGYRYITVDMDGYREGSMDQVP